MEIKKKVADLLCTDAIGQLVEKLNHAKSVRAKLRDFISDIHSSRISGVAPLSAYSKELHNLSLLNERINYLEGEISKLQHFQRQLFPQIIAEEAPVYGEPCEEEIPYTKVGIGVAGLKFQQGAVHIPTQRYEQTMSVYNIRNKIKEAMSPERLEQLTDSEEQYHMDVCLVNIGLTAVETFNSTQKYRQLSEANHDILDIAQMKYELDKYDLKLCQINEGQLTRFDLNLKPGFVVSQTEVHTPKTVEVAVKQLNKYTKELHRKEMVPSSYFGSDTEYPVYYGEGGTVYIHRAYGVHLPEYLFKDGAYKYFDANSVVSKGYCHSTQTLDIRFIDKLDGIDNIYNTRYTPKDTTDVIYTTYVDNKGIKYKLGSKKSNKTFYDEDTHVTEIREISTKYGDGFSKSHKKVKADIIKSLEIITGVSLRKTKGYTDITDLLSQINYYINFNNDTLFYHYDEADKIIAAYNTLCKLVSDMPTTIKFVHEPVLARYFEDTNSGASRDVTGDSEYSDYREHSEDEADEDEEDEGISTEDVDVFEDVDDECIIKDDEANTSHTSINVYAEIEVGRTITVPLSKFNDLEIKDNEYVVIELTM